MPTLQVISHQLYPNMVPYLASARCQLDEGLLFAGLLPDGYQFGTHLCSLTSRDGSEDITLLMQQAALTRGGGKQVRNSSQQAIMSIGHDQVELRCSLSAQVLDTIPKVGSSALVVLPLQPLFVEKDGGKCFCPH